MLHSDPWKRLSINLGAVHAALLVGFCFLLTNAALGAAPTFSVQPASQNVVIGGSVNLTATATGTGTITYQWYKSPSLISGGTGNTLSLSNVQTTDAGAYYVVATNSGGSTQSNTAMLNVQPLLSVGTALVNKSVAAGGTLSLTGAVAPTSISQSINYQWTLSGTTVKSGLLVTSTTAKTPTSYSVANFQAVNAGTYTLTFSNAVSSPSTSCTVVLQTPLSITTQPQSLTVVTGSVTLLSVIAAATYPNLLTYQWYKNSSLISSATSATLVFASPQPSDSGGYYCIVYDPTTLASTPSQTVTLTVLDPPAIITHPQSATVATNQPVTLSVSATGGAPLTYQWSMNGNVLAGATSTSLAFAAPQLIDSGSYTCTVSNPVGTATSNAALLTVIDLPAILTQPSSQNINVGQTAAFSVTAGGSNLNYQWSKNGTPINGATSSSFNIPNAQVLDSGTYTVTAINIGGSATSIGALLSVNKLTQTITFPKPLSCPLNTGSIILGATTTSGLPITYTVLSGSATLTGSSLTLNGIGRVTVQADQAGNTTYAAATSVQRSFAVWAPVTGTATTSGTTPLVQLDTNIYLSEHVIYVIDPTITWSDPQQAHLDLEANQSPAGGGNPFPHLGSAYDALLADFPNNYFAAFFIYNTTSGKAANWITRANKGTGANVYVPTPDPSHPYLNVDFCMYDNNFPPNTAVPVGSLSVGAHEIGHAYSVFIEPIGKGAHWPVNSTVGGIMAENVEDQLSGTAGLSLQNFQRVMGDPEHGFKWMNVNFYRKNDDSSHFALQDLYLQALEPKFKTIYLLNNPVFNADHTISYTSVDTYDQNYTVSNYGARSPDYKVSDKIHRVAFIYIARDVNEVNTIYQGMEASAAVLSEGETLDTNGVSYLYDTRYRASINGRLADLDGNPTPTLTLSSSYITSADGNATIGYTAAAMVGAAPTVSVMPDSAFVSIDSSNHQIHFEGLPTGVHFFTFKAQTPEGKKTFAHVVVEVTYPTSDLAITRQPWLQYVTTGSTATFNVTATGSNPSYQWYRYPKGQSIPVLLTESSGTYSGTQTPSLNITANVSMDTDLYACAISNGTGSITSETANLRVDELLPEILQQPVSKQTLVGGAMTFTVIMNADNITNYGYYFYQWQGLAPGSPDWVDLQNNGTFSYTTQALLSTHNLDASYDGYQIRCKISNSVGVTYTAPANMTLYTTVSISTQPVSTTVLSGTPTSLSVVAAGTGPLQYQWYKNSVPISGGTSATLDFPNPQIDDTGSYFVRITSPYEYNNSNLVILTVNMPPSITVQPGNLVVPMNTAANLTVSATGSSLTYQWKLNGTNITGATASTYSIPSANSYSVGTYTVTVANGLGTVTSNPVTLMINGGGATMPAITTQPSAASINVTSYNLFHVTASGSPTLHYQWLKDGNVISGGTYSSLLITPATLNDAGNYTVTVSNIWGWATSNPANLTVNKISQTINFPQLPDIPFTFNGISLSATAGSGLPVSLTVDSGPASVNTSTLTLTGVGTVTLRAMQAGNNTYATASDVVRNFNVTANFDSWRRTHFLDSELADPGKGQAISVYGQDRLTNLMKYALGLDPKVNTTSGLPIVTNDSVNWTFIYTRPSGLTDINYSVEACPDLINWSNSNVTHWLYSTDHNVDTMHATVPQTGNPSIFFRLKVTKP